MNWKDLVTESHSSVVHDAPVVSYCRHCGTRYFIATSTFQQTYGRCSCSWSCCDAARPGNRPHGRHIAVRPARSQDFVDAQAGVIKDLRS